MSDRPTNDAPLFGDADEQERTYAPHQVPGSHAREVAEASSDMPNDPALLPHDEVSGIPFVPVRGDTSMPMPMIAPAISNAIHNDNDPDTNTSRRTD